MPNCDFYALGQDHRGILTQLLEAGECEIFESYSRINRELICFKSLPDFEARYGIRDGDWSKILETMHLQLRVSAAGGTVQQRRIELKESAFPDLAPELRFRYSTRGWGLVQLYLEAPHGDSLRPSHSNHNSATRAATWRQTYDDMGEPEEWDWEKITSFSRRLNSFVRRQAVAKEGSRVILPAAAEAKAAGLHFALA